MQNFSFHLKQACTFSFFGFNILQINECSITDSHNLLCNLPLILDFVVISVSPWKDLDAEVEGLTANRPPIHRQIRRLLDERYTPLVSPSPLVRNFETPNESPNESPNLTQPTEEQSDHEMPPEGTPAHEQDTDYRFGEE